MASPPQGSLAVRSRVRGARRIAQKLREARQRLGIEIPKQELEKLLVTRTRRRFLEMKDPDGGKWAPLSSKTRKKAAKKGPNQILYDTGDFYNSIKKITNVTAATFKANTGAAFRIGSDDPVSPMHHTGTKTMPQRRVFGIGPADVRAVMDKIRRAVRASTRKLRDT